MAQQDLKDQENKQQENVAQAVSKYQQFINEHSKWVYGILIAILVIGLAILCYSKFYFQPQKKEAMQQMFHAERRFQNSAFDIALNGDDNYPGFVDIIKKYGTKGGKDVYLYAGVCQLHLGNYKEAITYLKKYKVHEPILAARALSCIGDSYVGLDDFESALTYYDKAANRSDDTYSPTYLFKAGQVCEKLGDFTKAVTYYKEIKDKYPLSREGYFVDKYISRIETEQAK